MVTPGNRMIKYADDTYIVIPACNILSRAIELEHVADWAHKNNLKLNRAKSVETVFTDSRRKSHYTAPPILPDISRITSIKVLGVTFTNHVSISEHISDVICRCAQSLYAIKVLRCHGMNETHFKDSCAALLRFYMQPQLGGGLPQLLIGNELRHCLSLCAAWSLPGKRPNPDAAHC